MKDFIGQEIVVDSYVAGLFPINETPEIFKVYGFTPKKVRLKYIEDNHWPGADTTIKYPHDLIVLETDMTEKALSVTPKDSLGQDLAIDDYVFGSDGAYIDPVIFKITGFIPRKAQVQKLLSDHWVHGNDRLCTDLIKVDAQYVIMNLLKKGYT